MFSCWSEYSPDDLKVCMESECYFICAFFFTPIIFSSFLFISFSDVLGRLIYTDSMNLAF